MAGTMTAARDRTPPGPRRPTQRMTQWVLFGSLASGLGALAFQILGVATLGEDAYAPITVLWTIQYLSSTIVLFSAESYVTRRITLCGDEPDGLNRSIRVIAGWVLALALACSAVTWLQRDLLFDGADDLALVAGALILTYGGFFVIKGRMAGTSRFRSYGAATALESIGRILIALPVLLVIPTTQALAWVMPLGPGLVVLWWFYDHGRSLPPDPDTAQDLSPDAGAGRFLAATTTANAMSQTLLAAGPLVLYPLGASPAEVSVFFVVITAARVPLVFAIGGLLSRLLPPLTRLAQSGKQRRLRRIALLTAPIALGLGAIGGVVGYLIGPAVLTFVFAISPPPRLFVALTAFGVLLATAALFLNQILIARRSERRLVVPWVTALAAAAVTVVMTGGTPTLRVSTGFAVGEIVALLGLVIAVLTARAASPERKPTSPITDPALRA